MICNECLRGFLCGECELPTTTKEASNDQSDDISDGSNDGGPVRRFSSVNARSRASRAFKRDAALRDQQSTGRKRAARAYPLDKSAACEWRGNINCGGGTTPIKGCDDGMQLNRHHGPDKNTLNNDEGNVHRICSHCHNRWHSKNDPDYVPGKPLKD